jgi:CMP-N,N'-diacetyllegionaminic acid synthase
MKNIVGLILARGGSKRIQKKNLKNLYDKPLIAWTIKTALESNIFSDLIVSTDDHDIAEVAKKYGANIPWLRPQNLATDRSPSINSVLHAIDMLEKQRRFPDGLMLLQPTLPFRSVSTIHNSIDLFVHNKNKSVISFNEIDSKPEWCFRVKYNRISPLMGWNNIIKRSQDIPQTLQINGLIYLASPDVIKKEKSFLFSRSTPLITDDKTESLDIDTEEDFILAEKIAAERFSKN